MRTRLVVSFFICFLLQACSGASTTKTNGVSNTSGNDQAGRIALDTIGIDGAVEKFVWNEEDGIGFLIQDNSYLDFIKSSFTSRPVFAMQAAMPAMTQMAIVCKQYGGDSRYAAALSFITIIGGLLVIPVYMTVVNMYF